MVQMKFRPIRHENEQKEQEVLCCFFLFPPSISNRVFKNTCFTETCHKITKEIQCTVCFLVTVDLQCMQLQNIQG